MKSLRLRSGLRVQRPDEALRQKFERWPFAKYDGHAPVSPNRITPAEVDAVNRLGGRSSPSLYRPLFDGRRGLPRLLKRVPVGVALEDADLDRLHDPIVALLGHAMRIDGIKIARATKLLHLVRPDLVPVLDSLVEDYYWHAAALNIPEAFERLKSARDGQYAFELMKLMAADVDHARRDIDEILRRCSDCDFRAIPRNRVVESLIWHYYAG